jgi:hypothetical protein
MKMPNMSSFTLWAGCILALIFAISLIRALSSGPKEIPGTRHLHDTYYLSFSPWLHLGPLLGALLILGSGWMMRTSEAGAERFVREIQNQDEEADDGN